MKGIVEELANRLAKLEHENAQLKKAVLVEVSARREKDRLEQARAAESDLRQRLQRAAAAHIALSEAVATMNDEHVEGPLQVLANHARTLACAECAAVGVLTRDGEAFEWLVLAGASPTRGYLPPLRGLVGDVTRAERPVRVRDALEPLVDAFGPGCPPATSFLGVPLRHAGRPLGALYLVNRIGADEFSEADELSAVLLCPRALASRAPSFAARINPGPPPVTMSQPIAQIPAETRFTPNGPAEGEPSRKSSRGNARAWTVASESGCSPSPKGRRACRAGRA